MTGTEIGVEVALALEEDGEAAPEIAPRGAVDEVAPEREETTEAVRETGRDQVLGTDEDHVRGKEGGDRERGGGEGHVREDVQGQGTESDPHLETGSTEGEAILGIRVNKVKQLRFFFLDSFFSFNFFHTNCTVEVVHCGSFHVNYVLLL